MRKINITDYSNELGSCYNFYQMSGEYPGEMSQIIGNMTYRTNDTNNPADYYNPCVVPQSGYNYSFAKTQVFVITNWKHFSDVIGCDSIQNIGIYLPDKHTWVHEHGIELLVSHQPNNEYIPADGIIGLTGYPITDKLNVWHMSDFDEDHPYVIDTNRYDREFISNKFISQIRISSCALRGCKMPAKVRIVAEVE